MFARRGEGQADESCCHIIPEPGHTGDAERERGREWDRERVREGERERADISVFVTASDFRRQLSDTDVAVRIIPAPSLSCKPDVSWTSTPPDISMTRTFFMNALQLVQQLTVHPIVGLVPFIWYIQMYRQTNTPQHYNKQKHTHYIFVNVHTCNKLIKCGHHWALYRKVKELNNYYELRATLCDD